MRGSCPSDALVFVVALIAGSLASSSVRADPGHPSAPPSTPSSTTASKSDPPMSDAVPQPKGTAPFDGVVLNRGDRVALVGVTVSLDDGAPSSETDAEGRFAFAAVTVGEHKVHLRGNVTGSLDVTIALPPGKRTSVKYYVSRPDRYSSTVRGRRVVQEVTQQTLSVEEVKHIPGTQGDTLKAVQNLPGVARPPFNGGLLVVWGSAPEDTRTYVDGVYIPTLYHFSGLRSTVNSEFVQSLTFLPGGYGVEYGRGLGGAVEVESRLPKTDGYHGFAQIDVLDVSAMAEGPITKTLSFAGGARVSLINLYLSAALGSNNGVTAVPQYWDYQARLHWRPSPRDDVDLFFFGSDDSLHLVLDDPAFPLTIDNHTYYHRGLLRWVHRFSTGAVLTVTPSVGYDLPAHRSFLFANSPFHYNSNQIQYSLRAVARVPLSPWLRLDAGLDYEGTRYTLDRQDNPSGDVRDGDAGGFSGLAGPDPTLGVVSDQMTLYSNHVAPFVAMVFKLWQGRLQITPQARLEVFNFLGYPGTPREFRNNQASFEPRVSVRYQIHPSFALSAAVGRYHQAPNPQDLSAVFGASRLAPESGIHYVVGVEIKPTSTLQIQAQGFYKDLRNLVVRGNSSAGPSLENDGIGRVYGAQILIRQELWRNFFGWATYTISRSERSDHRGGGDAWRLFQYDQTHVLTLLASYKLPYGFQVGLRFRYATGNPYTPVARTYFDVNAGGQDAYVPLLGAPYGARLPAFNQLDFRIDKVFTFNRWKLVLYLDIENLYNAKSAEFASFNYNFTSVQYVSGLPFLPVLGVRGEF